MDNKKLEDQSTEIQLYQAVGTHSCAYQCFTRDIGGDLFYSCKDR